MPDAAQFEKFAVQRPGEGAALVIVVTGSVDQVAGISGAVKAALSQFQAAVDGPAPCEGCGG